MVRDMNEKGRVGWFVRGLRKGRGCHSQKSLRAPLVPLSLSFPLARISAAAVSKLFLRSVVKGWPAPPRATSSTERLSPDRLRIRPNFADRTEIRKRRRIDNEENFYSRVFERQQDNRNVRKLFKVSGSCKRKERQERVFLGSKGPPCIRIYIYIYLCSGYHAAGGMLIYTKRQDLCGRTARLSRNTAPELSRVGRNDTAKKG